MNPRVIAFGLGALCTFVNLGCGSSSPSGPGPSTQGSGGQTSSGGSGGSGGRSGTGGSAASNGTGGANMNTGGSAATGGATGTGGSDSNTGGATGTGGATTPADAATPEVPPADTGGSDTPSTPPVGPGDPSQGPTALGKIVYTQDFETDRRGISLSPVNLPPERVSVVADPLGKRGKVISVTWKSGDNYRTSASTQPRSWISNAKEGGYEVKAGTKVSYAWGQMWPDVNMDAFFAQNIGPGPVWELRLRADGTFNILCNKCGGNQDFSKFQPNRWYDFRVDMDWQDGGAIKFYVDGQMMRQSTVSGVGGAPCHWDGGIYNTPGGTASNKTRVTYISNLSVGER